MHRGNENTMTDTSAIEIRQLSKRYRLGATASLDQTLAEMVTKRFRRWLKRDTTSSHDDRDFWALRDVTFQVQPGEVIGVIGRNGAGKSTLLKILSQITAPTCGEAIIRGRVGSLLEVGTGFHPELSGRENVYLNGTILGMRKSEIDAKFDQIVEFSGIEQFLDTPVKRYSSGMYVRLAFAVAAHLEPEILIVDEVLAVGDFEFQRKCLGKMADVAGAGRTVLFVSHNMAAIQNLCQRVIWLKDGQVEKVGPTEQVVNAYLGQGESSDQANAHLDQYRPAGCKSVIQRISLLDSEDQPTQQVLTGGPLIIQIDYQMDETPRNPSFGIGIDSMEGHRIVSFQMRQQHQLQGPLPTCGSVRCCIPELPLVPGLYCMSFGCSDHQGVLDQVSRAIRMTVEPADYYGTGSLPMAKHGHTLVRANWQVVPTDATGLAGAA